MKVIDLLNKIANGEELPKKIKYDNKIFKECYRDYYVYDGEWLFKNYPVEDILNDEIEIIEYKSKKIEKLPYWEENTFKNMKECSYLSIEEQILLDSNFKTINEKLNEIIDYINNKKK